MCVICQELICPAGTQGIWDFHFLKVECIEQIGLADDGNMDLK